MSEALASGRPHRPGADPAGSRADRQSLTTSPCRSGRRALRAAMADAGCQAGSATTTTRRSRRRAGPVSAGRRDADDRGRSARWRPSTRARRGRPRPRGAGCVVPAGAAGRAPLRGAGVRRRRVADTGPGHGDGPRRIDARRSDDAGRLRRVRGLGAAPTAQGGVRVAGDPDRSGTTGRGCGGAGDFLLDHWGRRGTSTSPATCATTRRPSSSRRTARRWSTSRTGRRSGPGSRWWRRGSWQRWTGDTVETRVSTVRTDPGRSVADTWT